MNLKKHLWILLLIPFCTFSQKASKHIWQMPDGNHFMIWKDSTSYSKTYYVDKHHPEASDQNPGTKKKPFRTINQAAKVVQAGEQVMIRGGVYHEQIQPAQGGVSPKQMIKYQAYPGDEVIVTGACKFSPKWKQSEAPSGKKVSFYMWQAPLDSTLFNTDPNPFLTPNASNHEMELMHWASAWKNHPPFTLGRGIIFQEGERMTQMVSYMDLLKKPGSFWIDKNKNIIHIHPYNRRNPNKAAFEITTLQHIVYPEKKRLSYIKFEGITFEKIGNGFHRVGTGAVFTRSGHHWIIEGCTIRDVNSVALEIGARIYEHALTANNKEEEEWIANHPGGTIVKNNHIYNCGTGGIQGHTNNKMLVYNNHLHDIGWQHIEVYWECAAIKLLHCDHSLVAHNHIHDITDANAIWLDWKNSYSRITRNIIYNMPKTFNGAIFIEASRNPNMIDHNILNMIKGPAISLAYTNKAEVTHNLVMNGEIPVNSIVYDKNRTQDGKKLSSKQNIIKNNIFYHNSQSSIIKNKNNTCNQNIYMVTDSLFQQWQNKGWDINSRNLPMEITFTPSNIHITSEHAWPVTEHANNIHRDFFYHRRNKNAVSPGPFERQFKGEGRWSIQKK